MKKLTEREWMIIIFCIGLMVFIGVLSFHLGRHEAMQDFIFTIENLNKALA